MIVTVEQPTEARATMSNELTFTGKGSPSSLTPGEVFGQRVAEVRRERGWTQKGLVDRLAELGVTMDRATLARIEKGGQRAQNVSLTEVLAIAVALAVPPVNLFTPYDDTEVRITPVFYVSGPSARRWLRGETFLSYYPDEERGGGSSFEDIPGPEQQDDKNPFAGNRDYQFFFSPSRRPPEERS